MQPRMKSKTKNARELTSHVPVYKELTQKQEFEKRMRPVLARTAHGPRHSKPPRTARFAAQTDLSECYTNPCDMLVES